MWAILALGAALLTSFNPILYKRMLKDAEVTVVVWGVTLIALPLLGIFTAISTPSWPALDRTFALAILAAAGLNTLAHLASVRALKLADASLVTPLLVFSPVFTLLLAGLLFDEVPSARRLLGVVLVLAGAYWLAHDPGTGWRAPFRSLALKPGVAYVLLAGLLWALTPLLEKVAIRHTAPESPRVAALVSAGLLCSMLTPAVLGRGRMAIGQLGAHRRELALAGLVAGSAPVLGYTALSLGYVGYVTTLFRLSTVFTVIWSALFLGEPGQRQRLPASGVMVLGAMLVAA